MKTYEEILILKLWIATSIICTTTNTLVAAETTSDFRHKIYHMMTKLCPSADICRGAEDERSIDPPFMFKSCCYDCSCNAGCGDGTNPTCCFPLSDNNRTLQDCVYPGSNDPFPSMDYKSYYIVIKPPTSGCVTDDVNQSFSVNEMSNGVLTKPKADEIKTSVVDFLQDFLPVFSPSSGLIYRNPSLAENCYGIRDGIPWLPLITCAEYDKSIDLLLMSGAFESGELNTKSCQVQFDIPNKIYHLVNSQRCFDDFIHSCNGNRNFTIPTDIRATHEDIIYMCEMGLRAPYSIEYSNIFCFICNGGILPYNKFCYDSKSDNIRSGSFYALIDTAVVGKMRSKRQNIKRRTSHVACDTTNVAKCREVHCPSGQVRTDTGCTWILISSRAGSSLTMLLELSAVAKHGCYKLPDIHSSIALEMLVSPWSETWRVSLLMKKITQTLNTTTITECPQFVVEIRTTDVVSYDNISKHYRDYIGQNWKLNLNNSTVAFYQTLMRWSDFAVDDDDNILPLWIHMTINDSVPTGQSSYRRLYKRPYNSQYGTMPVTKTWFCEQIELEQDEYTLLASGRILLLNKTNTYMFESEFSMLPSNQRHRPRVCLNDTTFRIIDTAAEAANNHQISSGLVYTVGCAVIWYMH